MDFQGLKIICIEIFIVMLLKSITASPAVSRMQMDSTEGAETFKKGNPRKVPWAKAHGHGKLEHL